MKVKNFLSLFSGAAFMFGSHVIAHACSVCLTGANDPTADAFNASVLFLMATPYAVVGSIGGGLFYAYRRKLAKPEPEQIEQPVVQLRLNQEEVGR
jgi:hypothetical protein